MANHTFMGVQFHTEQQEGTSVPVWPDEEIVVVEQIEGSDDAIVHHLGRKAGQEFSLPLVVRQANWSAFSGLRGQTGTLALIGNATRQATLTKLTGGRFFAHEGFYKVTATWVG